MTNFVSWGEWNGQRLALLKAHYADGHSCSVIANLINTKTGSTLSRNAIIGKIHRLGLDGRPPRVKSEKRPGKPRSRKVPTCETIARTKRTKMRIRPHSPSIEAVDEFVDAPSINDLAIPVEQRKTLTELTADTCRWPVGDPQSPDFFFCGATPFLDHPYCHAHCRVAYHPTRKIEDDNQQASSEAKRRAYYRRTMRKAA